MDTAQAVTRYVRREIGYGKLLVLPDASADRWCVFEVQRRMSGGWDVPFRVLDDGAVVPGTATVRQTWDFPSLVYVHEIDGKYAEADPHLILRALRKQDRWAARDIARDMVRRIQANRAKRKAESSQLFGELALEHRRLFAKAAEEMGL